MPNVTVVLPCYNGADHLATSVPSVLAQTHTDFQLIIVDDGSTDQTRTVAEAYSQRDARIRAISQSNKGLPGARNTGLAASDSRYVSFLDADDTWHPRFLEKLQAELNNAKAAGVAYCGWQNFGVSGGRGEPFIPPDYENKHKQERLLEGNRWPVHAAMSRRDAIAVSGNFDEELRASEDYDFWLRIALQHPIVRVPEVLAFYHHHGTEQMSADKANIAIHHWKVQLRFLQQNPGVQNALGMRRVRELTLGELTRRGMAAYWAGDISAARHIFLPVLARAYGTPKQWAYMLSTLMPSPVHAALRKMRHSR